MGKQIKDVMLIFFLSKFQKETIALRTRSKLPLTTEALEQLEANFVAPDITADMYETDCDHDDDWNRFLRELMQVCCGNVNGG